MRRRGFSLAELAVFGALALALAAIVIALYCGTRRHDQATARRLDGVTTLATTLAHVWGDLWTSRAVQPGVGMIRFAMPDGDVEYRWPGAGRPPERAGKRLGFAPATAFGVVRERRGVPVLDLSVGGEDARGRTIAVEVPVQVPDAGLHRRFEYWGPPGDATLLER